MSCGLCCREWAGLLLRPCFFSRGCLRLCQPEPHSGARVAHWPRWPPTWLWLGFDYLTTRFGGPQLDPVSGPSPPSYGCGAVWPECLQLDAVCQVAAVHCPDLFWVVCVHAIRPCNSSPVKKKDAALPAALLLPALLLPPAIISAQVRF